MSLDHQLGGDVGGADDVALRPLRILINGTSARVGGGLSVLTHQLRALQAHPPANQLTLLAAPWNVDRLRSEVERGSVSGGSEVSVELVALADTQARIRFEQTELAARAAGFDLLFNPANLAPLRPVPVPSVLMLQNVAYFADGPSFEGHQVPVERLKRRMVRASVRRSDAVVVPTQALAEAVAGDLPGVVTKLHLVRPGPFTSDPAGAVGAGGTGGTGGGGADEISVVGSDVPTRLTGVAAAAARTTKTHVVGSGYVLSVANYYDYKRLEDVVRAWARADADGIDLDLLMVGVIPTEVISELRSSVPVERRDRLHFHGPIADPANLRLTYRGAAAVLCLSALECLSLVPVEAAALGVPVVLSDIAVHREFGDVDGLSLVPVGDVAAAAEALANVVRAPRPASVNLLSDWSTHVTELQTLFVNLVERRAGAPGGGNGGRRDRLRRTFAARNVKR